MRKKEKPRRKKLLLMGSRAFKAKELPAEVRNKIDEAIAGKSKNNSRDIQVTFISMVSPYFS